MSNRSRAVQTKSRLWEITLERAEAGTTSLEVVRAFKERYPELPEHERSDLIDLGLMVLAGRVAVSNRQSDLGPDLFSQEGYPSFVPIRVKNGNRINLVRRNGRDITPREYFSNVHTENEQRREARKPSKRQRFHSLMEEMRDKGLLDTTLPSYLRNSGG